MREIVANRAMRTWLEAGDLGFGLMVPRRRLVASFESAIEQSGLMNDAVFVIDVGPSADTLAETAGEDK